MNSILKQNNRLLLSIAVLYIISGYLIYLYSPEVSQFFAFENLNTLFNNYLLSLMEGIIVIFTLSHMDKDMWFDRIGISLFVGSLLLILLMIYGPNSITSTVNGHKIYLHIMNFAINPMLFFTIGSIWFIGWIHNLKNDIRYTNTVITLLVFLTAFFFTQTYDLVMSSILEFTFIAIAFYLNGMSKFTIWGIIISFIAGIFYIFNASYRLHRIKAWFSSDVSFVSSSPQYALNDNILLSLIDSMGIFTLILIAGIFLFIMYNLVSYKYENKSYKIFAIGVSSLILLSLLVNILYIFELSPIRPSSIYLFGYGYSIVIASSIIVGISMMLMKAQKESPINMRAKVIGLTILCTALAVASTSSNIAEKIEVKPIERAKIITDDNVTIAYAQEMSKLIFLNKFTQDEFSTLIDRLSRVIYINKEHTMRFYFTKQNKHLNYQIISYDVTKENTKQVEKIINDFIKERGLNTKKIYYQFELSGERRVYPYNEFITPLIGYTLKRENNGFTYTQGVKGIENYYDSNLTSLNQNRTDIYLNINFDLQQKLEKELSVQKVAMNADEITSIVIDPQTYNIKAFASSNRFHPKKIRREDFPSLNISAVEKLFNIAHYLEPIKNAIENEKDLTLGDGYKKFGFYDKSGIDLNYEKATKDTLEVNLVQLLKMYTVFYADGKIAPPSIAKFANNKSFEQIISQDNAQNVKDELGNSLKQMQNKPLMIKDDNTTAYVCINELEVNSKKYLQATLTINPKGNNGIKEVISAKEEKVVTLYDGIVIKVTKDSIFVRTNHDKTITEYKGLRQINPILKIGISVKKGLVLGRKYNQ